MAEEHSETHFYETNLIKLRSIVNTNGILAIRHALFGVGRSSEEERPVSHKYCHRRQKEVHALFWG